MKKELVYVLIDLTKRTDHGIVAVARSNYQAKQLIRGQENGYNIVRVRLLDKEKPNKKNRRVKTII